VLPSPFTRDFLNRLECLRIRSRREFLGGRAGSYSSPRRGTSLEFADYRRYAPGDDLRYLDWRVYARTDKLYIKLFRDEVDLFVYLFVDASGSMLYPSRGQKFDPACHVALALAYVALANHDQVKLHFLQPGPALASPFYRGRHRIDQAAELVASVAPAGSLDFPRALAAQLRTVHRPGKAFLISDLLMPVEALQQGLNVLRASNFDIAVIQVLSPAERDPPFAGGVVAVDSESGEERSLYWDERLKQEYRRRLERHINAIRTFCHQAGVRYSLYWTGEPVEGFVLETLPAVGLLR
jgi:uncharacterized protein (DUF58 family)